MWAALLLKIFIYLLFFHTDDISHPKLAAAAVILHSQKTARHTEGTCCHWFIYCKNKWRNNQEWSDCDSYFKPICHKTGPHLLAAQQAEQGAINLVDHPLGNFLDLPPALQHCIYNSCMVLSYDSISLVWIRQILVIPISRYTVIWKKSCFPLSSFLCNERDTMKPW